LGAHKDQLWSPSRTSPGVQSWFDAVILRKGLTEGKDAINFGRYSDATRAWTGFSRLR